MLLFEEVVVVAVVVVVILLVVLVVVVVVVVIVIVCISRYFNGIPKEFIGFHRNPWESTGAPSAASAVLGSRKHVPSQARQHQRSASWQFHR